MRLELGMANFGGIILSGLHYRFPLYTPPLSFLNFYMSASMSVEKGSGIAPIHFSFKVLEVVE